MTSRLNNEHFVHVSNGHLAFHCHVPNNSFKPNLLRSTGAMAG